MSPKCRAQVLAFLILVFVPLPTLAGGRSPRPHESGVDARSSAIEALRPLELSLDESAPRMAQVDTRERESRVVPIRFRSNHARPMRLEILDRHGRLVRTLAQGLWAAGNHVLAWHQEDEQGHRVASGSYTARLVAEDEEVGLAMARMR